MNRIRIFLFEENGLWYAVGLERFLLVQADSELSVRSRLVDAINAYVQSCDVNGEEPFAALKPAPGEYWERFGQNGLASRRPREIKPAGRHLSHKPGRTPGTESRGMPRLLAYG